MLPESDAAPSPPAPENLQFTGQGGDYFRIWIVNLLLSVLTLGIYSAWAKVRRMQYFYRNTQLAGASFDYHGDPIAILKGRLIAIGLLLAYNWSPQVSMQLFGITLLLLLAIMPWLLRQSFRFRLHNSSYRGLRFRFSGALGTAYKVFLLHGFFALITLYIAAPLFHQRLKKYQHNHSHYGKSAFSFDARVSQFYGAYAMVIVLFVGMMISIVGAGAYAGYQAAKLAKEGGVAADPTAMMGVMVVVIGAFFVGMLLIGPLWQSRLQNLIWNNTRLGEHRFRSEMAAWPLLGIYLSNFLLILLTLGFYKPWADVRLARYRASTIPLLPASDLDQFVAAQEQTMAATGEEAAEFFDFDIGL